MFISDTHLPQLFRREHYTAQEHFERELETMFRPGWHCVGALPDLPNDGDYITHRLLGQPLITWRTKGEVHTFLNVCAHRFSMLTDKPCGHFEDRMQCQYHGWEYDETGNTSRIPDARSFRPMAKGTLGLKEVRTELLGQLIYVTLDESAPPLREYLGGAGEFVESWFSPDYDFVLAYDVEHECNWKVVVENFLEAYHLDCVHPETFKAYPEEAECSHRFYDVWDHYINDYSKIGNSSEKWLARAIGVAPTYQWHHILRYPNILYGRMAAFPFAQTVYPLSPTRCRVLSRFFVYPGQRGTLRSRIVSRVLRHWGRGFWKKVVDEDGVIFPEIQKGLNSPVLPGVGLVSKREERIFRFQEHVLQSTGSTGLLADAEMEKFDKKLYAGATT